MTGRAAAGRGGRALPTAIVLLGAVMNTLGTSSVTAAFPVMAGELNASPATIAWVALAYTLTTASLLTVFGRLADLRGRKRLYALGIALYLVGAVFAGLSGSVAVLVGWRVLQGVGAALVLANSVAYLVELYPPARRGAVVGWWEAAIAAGQGVGPVLGGLLLAFAGWPAVFYVNIPVCLLILALVPRYMVEPPRPAGRPAGGGFDLAGAALFAGGLALLLYGLVVATERGWSSPAALGAIGAGLAAGVAFVWVERRAADPMVDLDLFRSRGFSAGNVAKVCAYLSFAAHGLLLPFYLYRGLGLSPAAVGLALILMPLGMLGASLVAGPLSDRIGTRLLAAGGVGLLVLAALILAWVTPAQGLPVVAVAMVLAGIGIGTFIAPNDSAILAVTPSGRLGVANGIMGVSRSLGILLGQAVAAGVLSARLAASGGDFVPSFHATYVVVALLTALGIGLAAVRDRPLPPAAPLPGPAGARSPAGQAGSDRKARTASR